MRVRWRDPRVTASECFRWSHMEPTADAAWQGGVVDHYAKRIRFTSIAAAAREFERIRSRLFRYDIFSRRIVRRQFCPDGPLGPGTVIVQRFGSSLLAVETAVRVIETWGEDPQAETAGFVYVTLPGHLERGVSFFEVRRSDADVTVAITARSRPGGWPTRLSRPLSRWAQRSLTARAVRNLADPVT
jgi:uncharacterized protein (UPF0548 family)